MAPSSYHLWEPPVNVIGGDIPRITSQNLFYTWSSLPEQVNVSSAVLKAAAHHYGSQCDKANKEFMLCRWEEKDPRKCLEEGKKVNECAINFFRWIQYTTVPVCARTVPGCARIHVVSLSKYTDSSGPTIMSFHCSDNCDLIFWYFWLLHKQSNVWCFDIIF